MSMVADVDWKARYEESERRRADAEQLCEMWKCRNNAMEAMLQAPNVNPKERALDMSVDGTTSVVTVPEVAATEETLDAVREVAVPKVAATKTVPKSARAKSSAKPKGASPPNSTMVGTPATAGNALPVSRYVNAATGDAAKPKGATEPEDAAVSKDATIDSTIIGTPTAPDKALPGVESPAPKKDPFCAALMERSESTPGSSSIGTPTGGAGTPGLFAGPAMKTGDPVGRVVLIFDGMHNLVKRSSNPGWNKAIYSGKKKAATFNTMIMVDHRGRII